VTCSGGLQPGRACLGGSHRHIAADSPGDRLPGPGFGVRVRLGQRQALEVLSPRLGRWAPCSAMASAAAAEAVPPAAVAGGDGRLLLPQHSAGLAGARGRRGGAKSAPPAEARGTAKR
jgi:hypothetical protein